MFTAKIGEIRKGKTRISVLIYFYLDSELHSIEEFLLSGSSTLAQIKKFASNKIVSLQATNNFVNSLAENQAIDLTPELPTQEEIDKNIFLTDYRKWVNVKKAIDVGILTGNELQVVALLDKVKANFKPAYLDYI